MIKVSLEFREDLGNVLCQPGHTLITVPAGSFVPRQTRNIQSEEMGCVDIYCMSHTRPTAVGMVQWVQRSVLFIFVGCTAEPLLRLGKAEKAPKLRLATNRLVASFVCSVRPTTVQTIKDDQPLEPRHSVGFSNIY